MGDLGHVLEKDVYLHLLTTYGRNRLNKTGCARTFLVRMRDPAASPRSAGLAFYQGIRSVDFGKPLIDMLCRLHKGDVSVCKTKNKRSFDGNPTFPLTEPLPAIVVVILEESLRLVKSLLVVPEVGRPLPRIVPHILALQSVQERFHGTAEVSQFDPFCGQLSRDTRRSLPLPAHHRTNGNTR